MTAELGGQEALLALVSMGFSWGCCCQWVQEAFPPECFSSRGPVQLRSVKFVWAQQLPAVTPLTAGAVPRVNTETAPLMVSIKHKKPLSLPLGICCVLCRDRTALAWLGGTAELRIPKTTPKPVRKAGEQGRETWQALGESQQICGSQTSLGHQRGDLRCLGHPGIPGDP